MSFNLSQDFKKFRDFDSKLQSWRVSEIFEFLIIFGFVLAVRASLIFPFNYSNDTYFYLIYPQNANLELFAKEMRIFGYGIICGLDFFGAVYPYAGSMWQIAFCAALSFVGVMLRKIWIPEASSLPSITTGVLFALFPYHSDYLSYHNAAPGFISTLILGILGMYFSGRGPMFLILSALALVYAMGNQILFGYFFLILLFGAFHLGFGLLKHNLQTTNQTFLELKSLFFKFGLLVACTFSYLLLSRLVMMVFGIESGGRLEFSTLTDFPDKVDLYLKNSYYFLLRGEATMPFGVKALQLGILAMVLPPIFISVFFNSAKRFITIICGLVLFVLLVCAIGACMGVVLPIKTARSEMMLRVLSAISVYWAGVFALTWSLNNGLARSLCVYFGLFLAIAYAFNTNRHSADFARINQRDRLTASRMVERLVNLPEFSKMRTVAFVNDNWEGNFGKISTQTGSFNVSPMFRSWANTAILCEVSGLKLEFPSTPDREIAKNAAVGKPEWPAPRSVFIEGDVGVVVLPKGEK